MFMREMQAGDLHPADQELLRGQLLNDLKGGPVIQPLKTLPAFGCGISAAVRADKRHIVMDFGKS